MPKRKIILKLIYFAFTVFPHLSDTILDPIKVHYTMKALYSKTSLFCLPIYLTGYIGPHCNSHSVVNTIKDMLYII